MRHMLRLWLIVFVALMSACSIAPVEKPVNTAPLEQRKNVSYCGGIHPLHRFDFYPAEGVAGSSTPLVILIHGGAWSAGTKDKTFEHVPYIVALNLHGISVASMNYRLAPEVQAREMLQDVACLHQTLRHQAARYQIDPKKFGLMGFSAGGHLALMSALESASLNGAPVVAFYPVTDPSQLSEIRIGRDKTALKTHYNAVFGSSRPEALQEYSLVHNASLMHAPVMLVHGVNDNIVSVEQSRRLKNALHKLDREVVLLEVVGAQHGLRASRSKKPTIKELAYFVVDFFRRAWLP